MKIGTRIKDKRIEMGMTQKELAEKMGYTSKSSINKIENNINDIPQSKIVKFAEVLNTSVAYLMGWEVEAINNVSEQQKESIDSIINDDEKIRKFMIEIVDMNFNDEELQHLLDYAKLLKKW